MKPRLVKEQGLHVSENHNHPGYTFRGLLWLTKLGSSGSEMASKWRSGPVRSIFWRDTINPLKQVRQISGTSSLNIAADVDSSRHLNSEFFFRRMPAYQELLPMLLSPTLSKFYLRSPTQQLSRIMRYQQCRDTISASGAFCPAVQQTRALWTG